MTKYGKSAIKAILFISALFFGISAGADSGKVLIPKVPLSVVTTIVYSDTMHSIAKLSDQAMKIALKECGWNKQKFLADKYDAQTTIVASLKKIEGSEVQRVLYVQISVDKKICPEK